MTEDLDALARQADTLERAAAGEQTAAHQQAEPQPEEPPEQACIKQIVSILGGLRGVADARDFPHVVAALDDKTIDRFAGSLAPLLVKYNIRPSEFFGQWEVEIMAVLMCGPVIWGLIVAFRADWEAKAAALAKEVKPTDDDAGKS